MQPYLDASPPVSKQNARMQGKRATGTLQWQYNMYVSVTGGEKEYNIQVSIKPYLNLILGLTRPIGRPHQTLAGRQVFMSSTKTYNVLRPYLFFFNNNMTTIANIHKMYKMPEFLISPKISWTWTRCTRFNISMNKTRPLFKTVPTACLRSMYLRPCIRPGLIHEFYRNWYWGAVAAVQSIAFYI